MEASVPELDLSIQRRFQIPKDGINEGYIMTTDNPPKYPKICTFLDGFVERVGRCFAWLNVVLIAVIIIQVILRYVFGRGVVILEELQFHFYGMMLILAISYTLVHNGHIRLDLFHAKFKQRNKEKVELFGIIFLLTPMIVVIFLHSLDFLADSWKVSERSDAPMGLCCRWAFKTFIPIGFVLLGMAAASRAIKAMTYLIRKPKESK
jgi:TRAP-type mannitol/chloroaromatic compound transport system permease small subunit